MDQDKVQKFLEKQKATLVAAAHTQAERAIGEAAVRLHNQGAVVTTDALIAELLALAHTGQKNLLLCEQCEHAARLLGWMSAPQD